MGENQTKIFFLSYKYRGWKIDALKIKLHELSSSEIFEKLCSDIYSVVVS